MKLVSLTPIVIGFELETRLLLNRPKKVYIPAIPDIYVALGLLFVAAAAYESQLSLKT